MGEQWTRVNHRAYVWQHLWQETHLGVLHVTWRINKQILAHRACWATGTSSWGNRKSMIYHPLGWKRPWLLQRRSHGSSQDGKGKRQVAVKAEICEASFHRAFSQTGSQGIRETWIFKCSDGGAGRWGRSNLMLIKGTWELLPQFPEAQTGPQPPLFIGTPEKAQEKVLFISFPIQMYFPFLTFLHSVLTQFSSVFITLISHTHQQKLSYFYSQRPLHTGNSGLKA